jgi:hypothetical protein
MKILKFKALQQMHRNFAAIQQNHQNFILFHETITVTLRQYYKRMKITLTQASAKSERSDRKP